jgi:lactate dehydrogenase-like 2-hydroxyacid dehydrogenase
MTTNKPLVMLVSPVLERFADRLSGDYEIVRPWTYPSMEDFIAGPGQTLRVVATMSGATPENAVLERMPNLGLLACFSTGFEGIDLDWCRAHGVQVSNGAAANGFDVADQALGLMIAAYRRFTAGGAMVRTAGAWKPGPGLSSRSLRGSKAGVVGMGRIGQAIADRLTACGMQVSWYGPNPKPDLHYPRAASLLDLARECDALVLAAPANAQTAKLVDRALIDALGSRGVIVNIARGSLVDEVELIAALREGRLMAAGLDVFEEEPTPSAQWADVPNLELMPHSAGSTPEGGQALVDMFCENLRRYFAGEPLASPLT